MAGLKKLAMVSGSADRVVSRRQLAGEQILLLRPFLLAHLAHSPFSRRAEFCTAGKLLAHLRDDLKISNPAKIANLCLAIFQLHVEASVDSRYLRQAVCVESPVLEGLRTTAKIANRAGWRSLTTWL